MAVQREQEKPIDYGDKSVTNGISVFDEAFDTYFSYDGDDLGCHWKEEESKFVLWAPTAAQAELVIYENEADETGKAYVMNRNDKGVWRLDVREALLGKLYTYRVKVGEQWNEAVDPYAKAVSVNGFRGAIVDLAQTSPNGWEADSKPPFAAETDAIIYEVHVRDLTMHPDSGSSSKGTFLGAAEEGTKGPQGIATGLDHIASLGVTHVQFLPIYDYSEDSVDERNPSASYNWGYDPKNYNTPEGSYSTDPYDPVKRIQECKTMIQAYHRKGMRVIMDVVYNHMYDVFRANFTKLVPGYYFRHEKPEVLSNGSACGNDTASERAMMRKFIVDSVLYWAREYHIDGFRFDLMGLHDVETMNEIRRQLDELDPSILMTGEGWVLDTALPEEQKANQKQASKMPRIAQFNDDLRDSLKGSIFYEDETGFVNGHTETIEQIKKGIAAGIAYKDYATTFAAEPNQNLNYAECHDNHTLWDKLALSRPDADEQTRTRMHRLCSAILFTSQGMAFIHAGQEFMRTKNGVENSYKSPDSINQMDWQRCAERAEDVAYMRTLIQLRKSRPAFRLRSAEQIREHLQFEDAPAGAIAYRLLHHAGGDKSEQLYVAINGNEKEQLSFHLPESGNWQVVFDSAGEAVLGDSDLQVGTLSLVVLEKIG
ncbi:type I pullulanase [Marinicrinis sediminis]|uniref:Type I pullulanase n=1 Tax=Marinicrinis sediminis TaxID=1652465 RepID=A0ABW5REP4_9BACL